MLLNLLSGSSGLFSKGRGSGCSCGIWLGHCSLFNHSGSRLRDLRSNNSLLRSSNNLLSGGGRINDSSSFRLSNSRSSQSLRLSWCRGIDSGCNLSNLLSGSCRSNRFKGRSLSRRLLHCWCWHGLGQERHRIQRRLSRFSRGLSLSPQSIHDCAMSKLSNAQLTLRGRSCLLDNSNRSWLRGRNRSRCGRGCKSRSLCLSNWSLSRSRLNGGSSKIRYSRRGLQCFLISHELLHLGIFLRSRSLSWGGRRCLSNSNRRRSQGCRGRSNGL